MSLAVFKPQYNDVKVSVDHRFPVVAAKWVNCLVEDESAAVKAQDVAEAEKSIEFLKQQPANTSLADLQAIFFEPIQSQIERVVLAEVRPECVFKLIDPAVIPEEASGPPQKPIFICGSLLRIVVGATSTLIRRYWL